MTCFSLRRMFSTRCGYLLESIFAVEGVFVGFLIGSPLCNAAMREIVLSRIGCLVLILSNFFPSQVYLEGVFYDVKVAVADLEASISVGL
ncbi:hypothetical protein Tco_1277632 [Tanacetum coccineum]